jgi:hypothetical protein
MKKIIIMLVLSAGTLNATQLQDVYNNAITGEGYDKLIILKKDSIYYGGLIQDVESLCIHGNGAIIDVLNRSLDVYGEGKIFDIDHCVIKSSYDTTNTFIIFKNNSAGKIINNTFYGRINDKNAYRALYFEECPADTSIIINNIFYGFNNSIYFYTSDSKVYFEGLPLVVEYNLHWESNIPYLYWGGWTGDAAGFRPIPGNGEKLNDPDLINPSNNQFELSRESPCIDNGRDTKYQYLGNAPDIGALESSHSVFRGTKLSGIIVEDLVKSKSPYIIFGDVSIDSLSRIAVNPGVEIRINYLKSIQVNGELHCSGAPGDSIGIMSNSIYKTPWGQIQFNPNSSKSNLLRYANIQGGSIICSNCSATIQDCRIESAVYCEDNCVARILNNTFYNGGTFTGNEAIICRGNSRPLIENNILYSSFVYSDSSHPRIMRNRFMGQTHQVDQQYWLLHLTNNSSAYSEANFFSNNYGAILVDQSACIGYNNLITYCETSYLYSDNSTGRVINNTIFSDGYGIRCARKSSVDVVNSIIYTVGEWSRALQVFDTSKISARYCLLTTEFDGENLIYDRPHFAENYNIDSDSPCVDAGTPDTVGLNLPQYDYGKHDRIINNRIDIGCCERTSDDNVEKESLINITSYALYQNYPNPFNPLTHIDLFIPINSYVKMSVFNLKGQLVDIVIDKKMAAGSHSIVWDASMFPNGIYYYQLKTDQHILTKKCLLLK